MAPLPLTHHDILRLVEPFSRRGRHVDLGASDRVERRLVFRPIEHSDGCPQLSLRETLALVELPTGTFQLTRTLEDGDGLEASVVALGADPGKLLAAVSRVDPRHQFRAGPGFRIARSYEIPAWRRPPEDPEAAHAVFTHGVVRVGEVTMTLRVPSTRGVAATIELGTTQGSHVLDIPEDLLAVLGWDWIRLAADGDVWRSRLRLRGDTRRRGRLAELALESAGAHLARTLAEPPERFHQRWRLARWGVLARRLIPVLTLGLLAVLIGVLPHLIPHPEPGTEVFIFYIPVVLIAASFCLQEQAKYEIPARPRPPRAAHWLKTRPPP